MAVIEICDICRKEVSETNGITVNCSDWNGLEFIAGVHPSRTKREYKIRICDKCKENIIKYLQEEYEVEMTNTKEITRLLMRHYFKGRYFDLHKDDVILNTIQVYEIRDGELGRQVPFDIQVAGEDEYRIVPNSSNYEFFIAYYCLVKTRKIVIKAEDIPRYKNMDVSISTSFDKNGTVIN